MTPWITASIRPRDVIRQALERPERLSLPFVALVAGVLQGAMLGWSWPSKPGLVTMGIGVAAGAVAGLVYVFVGGLVVTWTAGKLGGLPSGRETREALNLSEASVFPMFLLWLVLQALTRVVNLPWWWGAAFVGLLVLWKLVVASLMVSEVVVVTGRKASGIVVVAWVVLLAIPVSLGAYPEYRRQIRLLETRQAVKALSVLMNTLERYRQAYGEYPPEWARLYTGTKLGGPREFRTAQDLYDFGWRGYRYTYARLNPISFAMTVVPEEGHAAGAQSFFGDHTGTIRHCVASADGKARVSGLTDTPASKPPKACLPSRQPDMLRKVQQAFEEDQKERKPVMLEEGQRDIGLPHWDKKLTPDRGPVPPPPWPPKRQQQDR